MSRTTDPASQIHSSDIGINHRLALSPENLQPIYDLNARLLHALTDAAQRPLDEGRLDFVNTIGDALLNLDDQAINHLAHSVVCLVDAGFNDASRWRDGVPRSGEQSGTPQSPLPRTVAQDFSYSLCVAAWTALRICEETGRLIFGMSKACAAVFRNQSLTDLPALARSMWPWIQPRWMDRPQIWGQLIRVAKAQPSSLVPGPEVCALLQVLGDLEPGSILRIRSVSDAWR